MSGARTMKLITVPRITLVATRMPISPPTPIMAASIPRRRPSVLKSVPRIFGVQSWYLAASM